VFSPFFSPAHARRGAFFCPRLCAENLGIYRGVVSPAAALLREAFIGKIVRRHAADRRATKAARPAPENLDFVLPVGTALGWQTPLNPPRCNTPHPRMATQIMGESGLRNPKQARLGDEKCEPHRGSAWGLEGNRFRESSSRARIKQYHTASRWSRGSLPNITARRFRVRCRDRLMADIMPDMVTNKSSTKRGGRISVRLSESLIAELEATAEREHRPLADYVRRLLVDAVAARTVQNEQPTAGA
jgi:hypothetical protein